MATYPPASRGAPLWPPSSRAHAPTCRRRPPSALLMLARELVERLQVELREPLALVDQPLLIAALQQVAGVRLDRLLESPVGQRLLEVLDVQPQRRVTAPLERPRPDLD